ncbi:hypothetical protein [Methylomonas sp. 2B]|uniref:hypothetical protein n=1 Tax=Methylomonas sp. 2B TaxID=3367743 RepID=UPI0037C9DAD5
MDETHAKALSIFNPTILDKKIEFEKLGGGLRFAHYTSADAAMNIIKNREIWLRNVQCMNDYMEVRHGIECLAKAYNHEAIGREFFSLIDSIFPNIKLLAKS